MPIIYGNPGSGRNHRTEQPEFDGEREIPQKKKYKHPRSDQNTKPNKGGVVRSDGKRYRTIKEAAVDVAGRPTAATNISRVCRGYNSTAYGYGWRYE